MKRIYLLLETVLLSITTMATVPEITSVAARQRYPWNGLVDIDVTFAGESNTVEMVECGFLATNGVLQVAMPITNITGTTMIRGKDNVWTRRFIWNATTDVGNVEVKDVILTVDVKLPLGGVQLWENGPYWAESNVGATKPEDSGFYFRWGDTEGYTSSGGKLSSSTYSGVTWMSSTGVRMGSSPFYYSNCPLYGKSKSQLIDEGVINANGELTPEHDAATIYYGAPWREPTWQELKDLANNCEVKWQTYPYGCRLVGKGQYATNSIFLPASGAGIDSRILSFNSAGYCWSSSIHPSVEATDSACSFSAAQWGAYWNSGQTRSDGLCVRAVRSFAVCPMCTHLTLDCRSQQRRIFDAEKINLSPTWETFEQGAVSVLYVDGVEVTNTTDTSVFEWFPCNKGTYTLTHKVMIGNEQIGETLSAKFISKVPYVLPTITSVIARQHDPWDGLVDIDVTFNGESNDVAQTACSFLATNNATMTALFVANITQSGTDSGSGNLWTRHYVWNVASDVGDIRIEDIVLTVVAGLCGVQLWENGPIWSECNVGATEPEKYGYYFWWGDTVGYYRDMEDGWTAVDRSALNYSFSRCPTSYKNETELLKEEIITPTGTLSSKHDAATSNLGVPWRMPTQSECDAMIINCTFESAMRNDVQGILVTGKGAYKSHSIFIPYVGYGWSTSLMSPTTVGEIWTSALGISDATATILDIGTRAQVRTDSRGAGLSVRPVRGSNTYKETSVFTIRLSSGGSVYVKGVVARQRYPWNGLIDIVVSLQGAKEDLAKWGCVFTATNNATKAALPVVHVTQNGGDTGSGNSWTRKYIWDAQVDIGALKIDDLILSVDVVEVTGGVQLWEGGPYWAECNVGAKKPEEYGYYFWWGDTVGYKREGGTLSGSTYSGVTWVSSKGATMSSSPFTSACPTYNKTTPQLRSAGYIDSTGNLVAKYDAATVHLGAPWRMPTDAEVSALISNCTTVWTNNWNGTGVNGRLVTGKGTYASKSIFLPAAGLGCDSSLYYPGSDGDYRSSTPSSGYSDDAWGLLFYSGNFDRGLHSRYSGQSVRPVRGFAK